MHFFKTKDYRSNSKAVTNKIEFGSHKPQLKKVEKNKFEIKKKNLHGELLLRTFFF